MTMYLSLATYCEARKPRPLTFNERRLIAQVRAKGLPNEQLLQEYGFTHSEHDDAFSGLIWGSKGYWVKRVSRNEIVIASEEHDSLRIWKLTIPVLFAYGQTPEGFDLDKRTPLLEGPAAKIYIIRQFVY